MSWSFVLHSYGTWPVSPLRAKYLMAVARTMVSQHAAFIYSVSWPFSSNPSLTQLQVGGIQKLIFNPIKVPLRPNNHPLKIFPHKLASILSVFRRKFLVTHFLEQVKIFEGRLMSIDYNVITIKLHASLLTHMMFYFHNVAECISPRRNIQFLRSARTTYRLL